jgi:hypothetical protein
MTDPDRQHTTEPAEGAVRGDDQAGGRTPHAEEPAEGADPAVDPGAAAGLDVPTPPVTPGEM